VLKPGALPGSFNGEELAVKIRLFVCALSLVAAALVAAASLGAFTSGGRSAAPAPDGIAVHGDWKITVKNPSGRVVRVHRFHNDFNGAANVAPILAHTASTGRYWLTLSNSSGTNNPCGTAAQSPCFDFEPDDPNAGIGDWFDSLNVSATGGQLVIKSEIEAQRDGSFDTVRMLLSTCSSVTAPNACHPGVYGQFSFRTLPSPITLVNGQQALVTVTYTFSAA
jgi:hypothetical protein